MGMLQPLCLLACFLIAVGGMEILSKSRLERCFHDSEDGGSLPCDQKIVLDMAVPSGSSGGEASLVAQVVRVQENNTQAMKTIRDPPVITIHKTATFALYALTYVRDVAYKPEEQFVKTRKCEPDAGADVVQACERLRDENGRVIQETEPICCPCGSHRVPSSCGNFFDKITKGKANTAYCLRFPGDWFHVFGIGTRSLEFSIRVQVKKGSSVSEVVVGPENRTVVSRDNFLRVNLVGDYVGYTNMPSFEDFYLVTPRKGAGSGLPQDLSDEYSKWMLLERDRFTLDGLECNKIGVGYEAYRNQPNFCSSPFWSCLYNQLWNFWEYDKNRINRRLQPQYIVEGRFQRINQHPNAGADTFSLGVTEVLNTNLLVELSADDIEYVYQRSPAKIIDMQIPTFEALSQTGTGNVTTKNIGKLESSYSLTFDCSSDISHVQEQFYIMKPDEVIIRSFYLRSSTDQAAVHRCAVILRGSDFSELDRAECQFTTKATVLENGIQIDSSNDGSWGFFDAIKAFWRDEIDFFTGRLCRAKCSSLLDFSCHMQYLCIGWLVMFALLLATLPMVVLVLWLLHQKGLFDPLHDCLEDMLGPKPLDRAHPRHKEGHHHRHPHSHGDHPHRHHLHQRHKSGHRHHAPAEAEEGHQHREAGHKHHAHGKAVAVEIRDRRHHERHTGDRRHHERHTGDRRHHDRDRDHHHSQWV